MAGGMGMLAIGTGLGGFLTGYDQAKQRAQQQQMSELRMQEARQQQQDRQRQQQAQAMAFSGLLGLDDIGGSLPGARPASGGGGGLAGDSTSFDGGGDLAPGFARGSDGSLTRNGQPPDTYLGGYGRGGGTVPAWEEGPIRPYTSPSSGSGFRSGLPGSTPFEPGVRQLTSMGVSPEVARGAVGYMARNESGNNPLAVNPASGAFGRAQWLGPRKAALTSQYGQQPTDEQQAQFMGSELQGSERGTLDRLLQAKTGKEGYDIWGRDYERPGQAALARAGVGDGTQIPPMLRQQSQQTAQQTAQMIDPSVRGRMALSAMARQIDKANPGADPVAKMLAIEHLSKMLAPSEQRAWEAMKEQNHEKFQILLQDRQDQRLQQRETAAEARQERGIIAGERRQEQRDIAAERRAREAAEGKGWQFLPTGDPNNPYVRANPNLGKVEPAQLPAGTTKLGGPQQVMAPELVYPEKWEGMPEKPPPGVRQDTWMATLEYVRTGKMPALGFQAGMRNQIINASPAAAHALGIDPSKVADLQAQYAGERHGEIVGGGRAAAIELGIQEAHKAAPQVVQTSKAVPRTEFPPINTFWNWLQQAGGDPNIVAFKEALNTYLNVYASTVSRTGRLTDSQQKHAYDLLSTSFNQGQIERGMQQLDYEMSLMKEAVEPAMENIQRLGQPPAIRQPQTRAPSPQEQNQQGAPGSYTEGQTATNPQTGEKMIYLGGQWVPAQAAPPVR